MNLQSLKVFRTAAWKQSLSAAAEELLYAPSTVTMHIRQLEAEWGVKLFEKDGRGVKLTQDGWTLLAKVESILDQVHQLERNVNELEKGEAGHIRIGAVEPVGSWRVAPILADFTRNRHRLQINLETGSLYSIGDRVEANYLDLGIIQTPLPDCPLPFEPLYVERFQLLIREDHPLARQDSVKVHQLREERLLFTETIASYPTATENHLTYYRGNNPYAGIELNSIQAAITFVQKGIGIAILPEICVTPTPDKTVVRPIADAEFAMTIGLLHRKMDAPQQKVLHEFVDVLRYHLCQIK